MAPDTSRKDVHLANEQNNILIRWSLVLNFLTYRSDKQILLALEIIFGSIKEINCPKTDCPKKYVVLFIVEGFLAKQIYKKEKGSFYNFLLFNFLSDNSKIKYVLYLISHISKSHFLNLNI